MTSARGKRNIIDISTGRPCGEQAIVTLTQSTLPDLTAIDVAAALALLETAVNASRAAIIDMRAVLNEHSFIAD